MRQSLGVTPFKHLIKWCYPRAVAAFDPCAKLHDTAYKTVDWSKGHTATLNIDHQFLCCCLAAAGEDKELRETARFFYRVARKWGIWRARLWKIGIRY